MTAQDLINTLLAAEMDPERAPDCRRTMRDERIGVQAALALTTRPREIPNDPRGRLLVARGLGPNPRADLARRMREAEATARAWGII